MCACARARHEKMKPIFYKPNEADELTPLLFHGTGARRRQSIKERGLLAKPDSYVYATSNPTVAAVFATARATQEDDWGLIIAFKKTDNWEIDPQFPHSFRRRQNVPASDIVTMGILDPAKERKAYIWLKKSVKAMKIRIEK